MKIKRLAWVELHHPEGSSILVEDGKDGVFDLAIKDCDIVSYRKEGGHQYDCRGFPFIAHWVEEDTNK
jgi:hypothetical protein